MTNLGSTRTDQNSLTSNVSSVVRSILGNRFGLLAVAAGVIVLGAYSSWGWLVAAGLAPLLLSLAPCAAMCALGMCAMGAKKTTTQDGAMPGRIEGPDAKSPHYLAAPGATDGTFSALNQPTTTKANTKKGCC